MTPALTYRWVGYLRTALLIRARNLAFALRPDLAQRRDTALARLEDADPAVSRAAVEELSAVYDTAMTTALTLETR